MPTLLAFKPQIGRYRFDAVIDETQYVFKVRWNSIDKAWFFDVLETDGTPIATGVKIVCGLYLARTVNHPLFLQGVLLCRCTSTDHSDPTFDDLGVRVQVWYFNRGDMAAELFAASQGGGV